MKTVEVPDDFCEDCYGRGTRALHGMALTAMDLESWSQEEIDDYISGRYDTKCEVCDGTGKSTEEERDSYHEAQAMLRAEAPHMFI